MNAFLIISLSIFFCQETPMFSEYAVATCEEFEKVEELDLKRLSQVERATENARYQWQRGENVFACKFFIVEWGCGTGCQMNAIFNQMTGEFVTSFNTSLGCEYRPDSKLLVINGDPLHETSDQYFIIEKDELIKLNRP